MELNENRLAAKIYSAVAPSEEQSARFAKFIEKKYGEYVNVNRIKPEDYLFITSDTTVVNEKYKLKSYHFYKESELTYKVVGVPSEPLYIRSKTTDKVIGKLYNGNEVLKFDNNRRCLVYHYEALGLTYKKYLKK